MVSTHLAVVSSRRAARTAGATVRSFLATAAESTAHVLDIDGTYRTVGSEDVLSPLGIGLDVVDLHRAVAALEPDELDRWLHS